MSATATQRPEAGARSTDPAASRGPALERVRHYLAMPLVAGALVALLTRANTMLDPIKLDASVYLTVADGMLHGMAPYRDIFDHKGPLTYVLFAIPDVLAPRSELAVRLFFFALFVWSLYHVVSLVGRHAPRSTVWLAAVTYGLVGSSRVFEGGDPNLEQLTLPFVVAAVELADRFSSSGRLRHAAGAGAALAAAVLVKPNLGLILPLALVIIVLSKQRRVAGALAWAAAGTALTAVTLAPIVALGLFDDMWEGVVDYNNTYVDVGLDQIETAREWFEIIFTTPSDITFGVTIVAGIVAWLQPELRRLIAITGAWALLAVIGIKMGGIRNWEHYYVSVLPPMAIIIAAGVDAAARMVARPEPRARAAVWAIGLAPLVAGLFLVPIRDDLKLRDGAPINLGSRADLEAQDEVADIVKRITTSDEKIYVVPHPVTHGDGQAIYWLSDRRPASKYTFPTAMFPGPFAEIEQELLRTKPTAIVVMPAATPEYASGAIAAGGLTEVATVKVPGTIGVKIFGKAERATGIESAAK